MCNPSVARFVGLFRGHGLRGIAQHHRAVPGPVGSKRGGCCDHQRLRRAAGLFPLPPESVDVVISNCVINLSADKGQVLCEAFRVLAPGGRFAVSDIVYQGHIPQILRADLESWAGCIAGALEEEMYRALLASAGFTNVEVEVTRRYALQDIVGSGAQASVAALGEAERRDVDGRFVSAFIRAQKPVRV